MATDSYLLHLSRFSTYLQDVLAESDAPPFGVFIGCGGDRAGVSFAGHRVVPGAPPEEVEGVEGAQANHNDVCFLFENRENLSALVFGQTTPQELYHSGALEIIGAEENALLVTIAMARAWNEEARG